MIMKGKKGLVMGVANDRSIAWGIAKKIASEGAEVAFTYQGEALKKRVEPLANEIGSKIIIPCDVSDSNSMTNVFDTLKDKWGELDFLVHGIGFSNKDELRGKYYNTSSENFKQTMHISCYSFTESCRLAEPIMNSGGSILTLTYYGAEQVMPHYNVMGVAKAALESTVLYLANDLGPQKIRVNAISPGPMRTLAGAAIGGARKTFRTTEQNAPLRSNASLESVGGTAVYLSSDYGSDTTGEIIRVDGGYHVLGMAQPENL